MNTPPYLSRTPPPFNHTDDENDVEEFGTFVVSSDLGEEAYEVFDKASTTVRSEDNVSEDSGLCMNSCGQTQSPCDISPLSTSYPSKVNAGVQDDTSESSPIESVINFHVVEEDPLIETNTGVDVSQKIASNSINDQNDIINEVRLAGETGDSESLIGDQLFSLDHNYSSEANSTDNIFVSNAGDREITISVENTTEIVFDFHDKSIGDKLNCKSASDSHGSTAIESSASVPDATVSSGLLKNFNCTEEPTIVPEISRKLSFTHYSEFTVPELSIDRSENSRLNPKNEEDCWNLDDEFTDFAEFQSSSETSFVRDVPEDNCSAFDAEFFSGAILDENEPDIANIENVTKGSFVWNQLQSIEETCACHYLWSNSCSNLKFLQAIQIDSRNIFHGRWSKMNKLPWSDLPSHCDNSVNSQTSNYSDSDWKIHKDVSIPDAHFDWLSSGLVNPLLPTHTQHHTTELHLPQHFKDLDSKKNDILASLPTLAYVKTNYIVFKRD